MVGIELCHGSELGLLVSVLCPSAGPERLCLLPAVAEYHKTDNGQHSNAANHAAGDCSNVGTALCCVGCQSYPNSC